MNKHIVYGIDLAGRVVQYDLYIRCSRDCAVYSLCITIFVFGEIKIHISKT